MSQQQPPTPSRKLQRMSRPPVWIPVKDTPPPQTPRRPFTIRRRRARAPPPTDTALEEGTPSPTTDAVPPEPAAAVPQSLVMDKVAGVLGGYDNVDSWIARYLPALSLFATETWIHGIGLLDRPSKCAFFILLLAVVQSALPLATSPLFWFSKFLSAWLLAYYSRKVLRSGMAVLHPVTQVASIVTTFAIVSLVEMIQAAAQKATGDMSPSLWPPIFLPIFLLCCPTGGPDTVASFVTRGCSVTLARWTAVVDIQEYIQPHFGEREIKVAIALVVGILMRFSFIGGTAIPLAIWLVLTLETIKSLGTLEFVQTNQNFYPLLCSHHLLAIWMWLLGLTTLESVPVLNLVREATVYGVQPFYLVVGAFFTAMLVAQRKQNDWHADAWYVHAFL